MTGSWKGRGNQYIEFIRVLYCKLPTNGKQLPAFPLEPVQGSNPGLRGGRRECYHSATVAPLLMHQKVIALMRSKLDLLSVRCRHPSHQYMGHYRQPKCNTSGTTEYESKIWDTGGTCSDRHVLSGLLTQLKDQPKIVR